MLALPFLGDTWVLLSREDLVVEGQQAFLPLALRTCRDESRLDIVIHQRIWKRGGDPSTGDVAQPGSMPIRACLLEIEDKQDAVILVLRANPVGVEHLGGELMRVACQIIEEDDRDLISMGLDVVRSRLQLLKEALWDGSRGIQDAMRHIGELWNGWVLCRGSRRVKRVLLSGTGRDQTKQEQGKEREANTSCQTHH